MGSAGKHGVRASLVISICTVRQVPVSWWHVETPVYYFLQISRYLHRNPVRANMVARPEDYRWSTTMMRVGP